MQQVTNENFEVETKTGVVVVDFAATWCGPCRMLSPVLEKLQNCKVVKVDIDQDPELAVKYQVSAVPKLVFMKNGVVKNSILGLESLERLQGIVNGLNE